MATPIRRLFSTALIVAVVAAGMTTPVTAAFATAAPAPAQSTADPDGPHSPVGRLPAATRITTVTGAVVRSADFGDISLGGMGKFRAPVRGYLVTPTGATRNTPLIVMAHLRYPACRDFVSAYPCDGPEMRFDRGMVYLGTALARRGYSVLIPDLSPLYVADTITGDYNQTRGLSRTLDRMIGELDRAVAGKTTRWGRGLVGRVDTTTVGLIAHSRSGQLAGKLTRLWQRGPHPIASVLDYGPAFDIGYGGEKGTSPAMPGVPLLVTFGDEDRDTEFMGAIWLGAHVAQRRTAPALAAIVPRLGHTYVNRELSRATIDDRICDGKCPGARAHERFLIRTATTWFDATLRGRMGRVPLTGDAVLPAKLGGRAARWLAVTNGPHRSVYVAGERGSATPFGPVGLARTCFPIEPMAPSRPGECPFPETGVTWGSAAVTQIAVGAGSGVSIPVKPVHGAVGIALALAPTADRPDGAAANPLQVVVRFADGRTVTTALSGREPALVDRATDRANGTYAIGTVRIPLPTWARDGALTSIELTGTSVGAAFDLRAVDVIR